MTRYLTPASTVPVTNWLRQVQMEWLVSTTCSLALALLFCKATKMKSVKSHLTHKVTRSSRRAATRRADCGPPRLAMKFSAWAQTQVKATKMKSSPALSTTKVIRLLRDRRTIPAAFGKMWISFGRTRKSNSNRPRQRQHSSENESSIYSHFRSKSCCMHQHRLLLDIFSLL